MTNDTAFCRDCGKEIPAGKAWCHACGQAQLAALERHARSRHAWDGGDVVVALAAVAGLLLLVTGSSRNEPTATGIGTWLFGLAALWLVIRSAVLSALVAWDRRRTRTDVGMD